MLWRLGHRADEVTHGDPLGLRKEHEAHPLGGKVEGDLCLIDGWCRLHGHGLILRGNRNARREALIPRRREDPGVRPEVLLALCLGEPTARHPDYRVDAAPVVQSGEGAPLREDLEDRAVLEAHGRRDARPDIGTVGRVVVDAVGLLRGGHFNG
jgi:hypothetical protein